MKALAGRRTLPLSAPAVQALRAHRELQDHERAEAVVWEDGDLVL